MEEFCLLCACHFFSLLQILHNRRKYHIEQRDLFGVLITTTTYIVSQLFRTKRRTVFWESVFYKNVFMFQIHKTWTKGVLFDSQLNDLMSLNNSHKVLTFASPLREEIWVDFSFTQVQKTQSNNLIYLDFCLQDFSNFNSNF